MINIQSRIVGIFRNTFAILPWRMAGIYTLTNFISAIIPFALIPILTRYLSPVDYGIAAMFQVMTGFVAPFVGLSMNGAIARMYYDETVNLPRYIGNCFTIVAGSAAIVCLVLCSNVLPLVQWTNLPAVTLWLVMVVAVSQYTSLTVLTLWQVEGRAMQYGIFKTATAFGSALLSVWLIAGRGMGWRGVVWSQVMSTGVAGAIGLYILISNREIAFKWDMPYIKAALRFGLPLIPHAFGGWLMMSADRLLINRMVSVTATGLYTVAFQVTSAITMLQISFNTAYVPWLFERLKRNDLVEEKLIVKLTYRYVGTMFIGSLVFGLIAPEIFQFAIGKNYHGASRFILWIAPAKGIEAMYYMTCNYIFYSTKTKYLALATIISAVIHMGVAYLLIGRFGAIGAAQATLISSVVLVMIVWWVAAKLHPMPWLINGRRRNAIG